MSTDQKKNETYVSHLVELRDRVLRSILVLFLCFLGLVSWAPDIYNVFADPLISALPPGVSMIATDVVAPFFVPIKVTFFVAFIISLPFILWQIWSFVANATLYLHTFGHVVVAWLWLRQARVALSENQESTGHERRLFLKGKLAACKYFYRYELPQIDATCNLLQSMDESCFELDPDWL